MPGPGQNLHDWVDSWAEVLTPTRSIGATEQESDRFTNSMVEQGTLLPLNGANQIASSPI